MGHVHPANTRFEAAAPHHPVAVPLRPAQEGPFLSPPFDWLRGRGDCGRLPLTRGASNAKLIAFATMWQRALSLRERREEPS